MSVQMWKFGPMGVSVDQKNAILVIFTKKNRTQNARRAFYMVKVVLKLWVIITLLRLCHRVPFCTILDRFGLFLEHFTPILYDFGPFLNHIAAFVVRFWAVLHHFGAFCSILEHFGSFLIVLERFGPFWSILERFWTFLYRFYSIFRAIWNNFCTFL